MLAVTRALLVLLLGSSLNSSASPPDIDVTFEATVPRHFHRSPSVFLSGGHPRLGDWQAAAVELLPRGQVYQATVRLPADTGIEFKLSLGKWSHVESMADGGTRPNRRLHCRESCTVHIDVENFKLHAFHAVPKGAVAGVQYHHDFLAGAFANHRSIAVYLPPQYFTEPQHRFPVLYALDGNNVFDHATMVKRPEEWHLDETLERLFAKGGLSPFIVVGVYNTRRRADEYLPCTYRRREGGMAAEYLDFLVGTIKPFVDERYRTLGDRKHTMLLGASFGGNFALFAAKRRADIFSRVIAMSPAYWWGNHCLMPILGETPAVKPDKLWIDMGDKEGEDIPQFKNGVEETFRAEETLRASGIPQEQLRAVIEKGGRHHEWWWGKRVVEAIRFVVP